MNRHAENPGESTQCAGKVGVSSVAKLSVAPMMDWTDYRKKVSSTNSYRRVKARVPNLSHSIVARIACLPPRRRK